MLDVAAVAHHLLTTHAPRATRRSLLSLIGGQEDASLSALLFIVSLHDLGKLTPAFQGKVDWAKALLGSAGYDIDPPINARHHGAAGFVLLVEALTDLDVPQRSAVPLARSVAAHHGEFPTDAELTRHRMGDRERGTAPRWREAREKTVSSVAHLFGSLGALQTVRMEHPYVMQLSGLTSVADWIGSMEDVFVYEPPQTDAAGYWAVALERAEEALGKAGFKRHRPASQRRFEGLFPDYRPWPLHLAAQDAADSLTAQSLFIIEAPMGEGKTEAALQLTNAAAASLGHDGFYVGLPTKATANQMFRRIRAFLERSASDSVSLSLIHGDASLDHAFRELLAIYDDDEEDRGGVRAEAWLLPKKRALLADYGVGTIDQALLGVLRVRHGFVRLYGLAGKTVVLDEVHAYDTFTSTLLHRLIEWLAALGATIVLLSATLPRTRRNAIVSAFCSGVGGNAAAPVERPYPRITIATGATTTVCHVPPRGEASTVTLRRVDPDLETIAIAVERAVRDGGCIGWICNTVSRAQTACEALARVAPNVPRLLIHARMLPETRTKRETVLQQLLGPERGSQRPPCYVVIGTQVLEQSLDIDFDLLVTDLAPIDLLLQRIGRLHRHRERSNRAAAHSSPEVWIAHAAGPPEEIPIQDVAVVYAEWLVRQTLRVLEGKSHIVLPNDIERLVEEVYGPAPPPADGALFGSYINHFGGGVALRQNAEQRLIPKPSCEDDIFRALTMPFADDEGAAVHEELKALTRDAQPAVQMVCLTGVDGLVYAAEDDTEAFDLDTPPAPSLAARLAHRTINVTHPAIHAALLNDPQYYPTAWRDSPLLRHRRAVVFTNNVATVAGRCLELHPELGLRY